MAKKEMFVVLARRDEHKPPIVWGIGDTPQAAYKDAIVWIREYCGFPPNDPRGDTVFDAKFDDEVRSLWTIATPRCVVDRIVTENLIYYPGY